MPSSGACCFWRPMDLDTACQKIHLAIERMRVVYLQTVFDEWAILAVPVETGGVVAYRGPRAGAFRRNLPTDAEPLRRVTSGKHFAEGDIEFVPDAADTCYDAFMKIGPSSYLVLNHTVKTIDEIRTDPKWLGVQAVLFELSEKFRTDPVEVRALHTV